MWTYNVKLKLPEEILQVLNVHLAAAPLAHEVVQDKNLPPNLFSHGVAVGTLQSSWIVYQSWIDLECFHDKKGT